MKRVSSTSYGGLLHMSVYMIDAQIIGHRVISIAWWTHRKGYVKYRHCTELTDKLFGCGCRMIGKGPYRKPFEDTLFYNGGSGWYRTDNDAMNYHI